MSHPLSVCSVNIGPAAVWAERDENAIAKGDERPFFIHGDNGAANEEGKSPTHFAMTFALTEAQARHLVKDLTLALAGKPTRGPQS